MRVIKNKKLMIGIAFAGLFLLFGSALRSETYRMPILLATAAAAIIMILPDRYLLPIGACLKGLSLAQLPRRLIAGLCAIAVTVSACPFAGAAAVSGLSDTNITLTSDFTAQTAPNGSDNVSTNGQSSASWTANEQKIIGMVAPGAKSTTAKQNCITTTTYYYTSADSSTLTLTNNSGAQAVLTFNYTAPRNSNLKINSTAYTVDGYYEAVLAAGASVTVSIAVPTLTGVTTTQNYVSDYTATTELTNVTLRPIITPSVTVKAVSNAKGTYKVNNTAVTADTTYTTNPSSTLYTFKATPAENCAFDGWYIDGVIASSELEMSKRFYSNATVEARFTDDPLYSIATLSTVDTNGNAIEATTVKSDVVAISSEYGHKATGGSWYRRHETYKQDGSSSRYFPDPQWSVDGTSIKSSASGTMEGDFQLTGAGNSWAEARPYSDILKIYAKQPCEISFNYTLTSSPFNAEDTKGEGVHLNYYKIANNGSVSASTVRGTSATQIITGTAEENALDQTSGSATSGSTSVKIAMNAGEYLYVAAFALANKVTLKGQYEFTTSSYTYSAEIKDVVITKINNDKILNVQTVDNLGTSLSGGKVKIESTTYTSKNGALDPYESVVGSEISLTASTAPTGYVFLGWRDPSTLAETDQADMTKGLTIDTAYDLILSEDRTVQAVYAPILKITMDGTEVGYTNATYENADSGVAYREGQYVARNSDSTKFYATLREGFEDTANTEKIVVLLAGHTIAKDFTIPEGWTLSVPYGLTDPGTVAVQQGSGASAIGASYCKVTIQDDLTIKGNLVVSARQSGDAYGRPVGAIGALVLGEDASVTVANGGTLRAYGLVKCRSVEETSATAPVQITVKNGGAVYELIEINDFRHPSALMDMTQAGEGYNADKMVLPFNHFFIKNIEGAATYEYGAKQTTFLSAQVVGMEGVSTTEIKIIGTEGSMFNIANQENSVSTLTKSYYGGNDRTTFYIDEGATAKTGNFEINMTVEAPLLGEQNIDIDTRNFYMPLSAAMGIEVAGDLTLNEKYKLLPGAVINVTETGTLNIGSAGEIVAYRLNDYDPRTPGTGVYQGYSYKGLAVNASRYNNADVPRAEYTTRTLATMGSAKIIVDGMMTVNGSLYVTEDLVDTEDTGLQHYEKGYNILEGTGTINVAGTTAAGFSNEDGARAIYEAVQMGGTHTPEYEEVLIVPIKGLPATAEEDAPENYLVSLIGSDIYYGAAKDDFFVWGTDRMRFYDDGELQYVAIASGSDTKVSESVILTAGGDEAKPLPDPSASGKTTVGWRAEGTASAKCASIIEEEKFSDYEADGNTDFFSVYAVAQIIDADGKIVNSYETLADALSKYSAGSYIQMIDSTEEDIDISGEVWLDLGGKKVTVKDVTGTLYGMDNTTDGYETASGGLILTNSAGVPQTTTGESNPKIDYGYVMSGSGTQSDPYTFNRFNVIVTDFYVEAAYGPREEGGDSEAIASVGFAAAFRGNDAAAKKLTGMGMIITASKTDPETAVVTSYGSVEEWKDTAGETFTDGKKGYCTVEVTELKDASQKSIGQKLDDYHAQGLLRFGTGNEWIGEASESINFTTTLQEYYDSLCAKAEPTENETNAMRVIESFMKATGLIQ